MNNNNNNSPNEKYLHHNSNKMASLSAPILHTPPPPSPFQQQVMMRQSLSSVINSPTKQTASKISNFTVEVPPPPIPLPRIELENFKKYVLFISKCYTSLKESRALIAQIEQEADTNYEPQIAIQKLQEKVPKFFFEESFSLDDPLVFHEISKLDASSVLQQEKLSMYLDFVEMELVNQLSLRSRDFFNALSRLQYLRDEVADTCHKIEQLRSHFKSLTSSIDQSLSISKYQQKKKNILDVQKKLSLIATVRQTQPTVQLLLSNNDYIGALELISQTQRTLRFDLPAIQSLRHVDYQLSELVVIIEKVMQEEFLRCGLDHQPSNFISSPSPPSSSSPSSNNNSNNNNGIGGSGSEGGGGGGGGDDNNRVVDYNSREFRENWLTMNYKLAEFDIILCKEAENQIEEQLSPLVTGLIHLSKFHSVLSLYSEKLNSSVRSAIQNSINMVPILQVHSSDMSKNPVHEAIKALNLEQFLQLFSYTFTTLLYILIQARAIDNYISKLITFRIQLISSSPSPSPSPSPPPSPSLSSSSSPPPPHLTVDDNNNGGGGGSEGGGGGGGGGESGDEDEVETLKQWMRSNNKEEEGKEGNIHLYVEEINEENAKQTAQMLLKLNNNVNVNYYQQVLIESKNALYSVCETAHNHCAKIYSIRNELHAKSSIRDFEKIFTFTLKFIELSESLCQRQCLGFRSTLMSQAKGYFESFHSSKSTQMALTLDSEKWTQAQVATEFQSISNQLFSGSSSSPSLPSLSKDEVNMVLYIKGEGYCVVNSALILLKLLSEYLICAEKFPGLITDILLGVSELLSLFNSRTCQLVLGAGATQLAKLKSITAKNLALASRCLKMVTVLIPKLKQTLEIYLPDKQKRLLNDLDRVSHDFMEHQQEIIEKLVTMMKDRVDVSCKNLAASTLWNERATSASPYVIAISKATSSLHKILMSHLPKADVQNVFGRIFAMYNASLVEYFSTLRLTPIGKKRLYNDIDCLLNSLTELEGMKEQVLAMMVLRDFFESQFGVVNPL